MGLKNFVKGISEDPKKLADFRSDPDAIMKEHGLTHEEVTALKSGDADQVKGLIGNAGGENAVFVLVYIVRGEN